MWNMTLRVCLNRSVFLLFSLSRELSPFLLHEHILSLLVSKLCILSLHSLYKFHVSCFVFSHFNSLPPASLSSLLHFNCDFYDHLTRSHSTCIKCPSKYESAITLRRMPGHIREFNRLEPHSRESRWVIDMSAASYKMTEMIPSTSAHLIDRSEDVIFELVWVIKRSILSFPVYITKKNVKSVTDSAVLHWTTRLTVFPRKAGFGRYMVACTSSQYVTLNCVWQLRFLITDEGLCIMSPNVCWKISRVSGKPCSIELMTSPDHTFSVFKQVLAAI